MSPWPAAAFGLVLGLMTTMHLARGGYELGAGVVASCLLAGAVVTIGPETLVPFGLVVVALAWRREGRSLGRRRKRTLLNPMPAAGIVASGLAEGARTALVPYRRPTAQEEIGALRVAARTTNPFRPEGPQGLEPLAEDRP